MLRARAVLILALFISAAAKAQTPLRAPDDDACARAAYSGLAEGPAAVPFYDADVATARRACPRTEFGLGLHGGAIIDTPGFYGDLNGALEVFGSWALDPRTEIFATLDALRAEFVQEATLQKTELHLGQMTVGASRIVYEHDGYVLTPMARLLVPTSTADRNVRVMGLELGASGRKALSRKLALVASLGFDGNLALGNAAPSPRGGIDADFGAEYAILRWFGLALDVNAHFGERARLDALAPQLAIRFATSEHFGAELDAALPVVGADRHDAVAGLRFTWRL